jgi:mannose/fructose/N-acetylgalactosamine-specific phosphotransferase system component IIC
MHDVLVIAIIAAVLALDDRAGWGSLLAEPVFSGTLVGLATGEMAAGMSVGLVLQLVWLSIGAARGSRRPNVVVGGVVAAAVMCLGVREGAGEARLAACSVLLGLLAGEAGSWTSAVTGRWRERWLEGFRLPADARTASRRLAVFSAGSALYVGVVDGLVVLAGVPLAQRAAALLTGRLGEGARGVELWTLALPGVALAVMAHAFATRNLFRFGLVGVLLAVVVTWLF